MTIDASFALRAARDVDNFSRAPCDARRTPNDLALWDNCSIQHYAVPDYDGERIMQRVVLAGDRPRGPQ